MCKYVFPGKTVGTGMADPQGPSSWDKQLNIYAEGHGEAGNEGRGMTRL